jgi:hypothetical protein
VASQRSSAYLVRMTRRSLILAACVAVVALGVAWWYGMNRLSVEERRLLGTWHPTSGSGHWTFGADRNGRFQRSRTGPVSDDPTVPTTSWSCDFPEHWAIRDGAIVIDGEMNIFRRAFRPVVRMFGRPRSEPMSFALESVTAAEMVIVQPDGSKDIWTRDRGN